MKRMHPRHNETRGLHVGGKDLKEAKNLKKATKEEALMLQRAKERATRMVSVRTRSFHPRSAKHKVDITSAAGLI